MINKQMKKIYEQNKKRDEEDPEMLEEMWNKQIEILTANLNDTIEYLKVATPEELYYVGEVFDDISEYWQSKELIQAMVDAANRCPENVKKSLMIDIKYARMAIKS